jgi:2-oxo-hept-3-ene-1,7-dioate hydratase
MRLELRLPDARELIGIGGLWKANRGRFGPSEGVLGHPAMGVAWLANKLGQHGVSLQAGHLVLSGSFTRVIWARKGDTVHGDFGQLGGVAVQFV